MSNEQTGGSAGGGMSRPAIPMPTTSDMPNEDELEDALLWAAQGFPPRNEQTVREAILGSFAHPDADNELWRVLPIDPDMSVYELQRRLRIADRVLALDPSLVVIAGLDYLTREDDQ